MEISASEATNRPSGGNWRGRTTVLHSYGTDRYDDRENRCSDGQQRPASGQHRQHCEVIPQTLTRLRHCRFGPSGVDHAGRDVSSPTNGPLDGEPVSTPSKKQPGPTQSRSTSPNSGGTANSPKSNSPNGSSAPRHRSPRWKPPMTTCSRSLHNPHYSVEKFESPPYPLIVAFN